MRFQPLRAPCKRSSTAKVSIPLRVFVIVPAFCEERLIQTTINNIPAFVEGIIVVDDASTDDTANQVKALGDSRTHLISHQSNRGVGAAIYTGYKLALTLGAEALVVMAGDNQMDGTDLPALLRPMVQEQVGYVKGNRHLHERVLDMPLLRRVGSRLLAQLTSQVTGVRLGDSQCGYTALSRQAALGLDFDQMWTGYGYPNDLLIALGRRGIIIAEVPVRPVYADEQSGLRPWHLFTILGVIARRWWIERRRAQSLPRHYSNEQLMG